MSKTTQFLQLKYIVSKSQQIYQIWNKIANSISNKLNFVFGISVQTYNTVA